MFERHADNPLITPNHVIPSRPDLEVIGAFNAGVTVWGDEVVMLLRVAERPVSARGRDILCPYVATNGKLTFKHISSDDPDWDMSDPRAVIHQPTGLVLLTSISHLRLARSQDGVRFRVDTMPWLTPQPPYESFGLEDARLSHLDESTVITCSAVSPLGVGALLVTTTDFNSVQRYGIVLPPPNKDVALFPTRFGDHYVCYHRPMPGQLGTLNIWLATSPDLQHWGNHQLVLRTGQDGWSKERIGAGAPPIHTEMGWLSIYHATDAAGHYCLGAFLTPHDEPGRIVALGKSPILTPEATYETSGFVGNVVFTCGAVVQDDTLRLYYGAADEKMALAEAPLQQVLDFLMA